MINFIIYFIDQPSTSTGFSNFSKSCTPSNYEIKRACPSAVNGKLKHIKKQIKSIKQQILRCQQKEKYICEEKEMIFKEFMLSRTDTRCICAYCQAENDETECDLNKCEFSCSKCKVYFSKSNNYSGETRCCANWRSNFMVKYKGNLEFDIISEDNFRRLPCPTCGNIFYTTKKREGDTEDSYSVHTYKCYRKMLHSKTLSIKVGNRHRRQCKNCNLIFRENKDISYHTCYEKIVCEKGCGKKFSMYSLMIVHVKKYCMLK